MFEGRGTLFIHFVIALLAGFTASGLGNGLFWHILGRASSIGGAVVLAGLWFFSVATW
jgi:hypothetical protein